MIFKTGILILCLACAASGYHYRYPSQTNVGNPQHRPRKPAYRHPSRDPPVEGLAEAEAEEGDADVAVGYEVVPWKVPRFGLDDLEGLLSPHRRRDDVLRRREEFDAGRHNSGRNKDPSGRHTFFRPMLSTLREDPVIRKLFHPHPDGDLLVDIIENGLIVVPPALNNRFDTSRKDYPGLLQGEVRDGVFSNKGSYIPDLLNEREN